MPQRRALIAALLLSVLLAQWLGFIHGIVHAPGPTGWRAPGQLHSLAERQVVTGDAARTVTGAAFDGHGDQSQCRLFDQLAHADLAWQAPPPLVGPCGGAALPVALTGGRIAAQATGYLARGPPARA